MQDIIWAFSRTPPESADEDAHISVHHLYGTGVLNLTRATAVSEDEPLPTSSPVPTPEAGDIADGGNTTTRPTDGASAVGSGGSGFASFVHAGLCILAFLLVIPSGALVVRYARATGNPAAFNLHRNLQFGVGKFFVFLVRVPLNYLTNCFCIQLARPSPGACLRTFSWIATALDQRTR